MAGGTTIVDRLNKLSGKDATTIAKALENVEEAGVGGAADWNENDPEAKGYIANRPFYSDYTYNNALTARNKISLHGPFDNIQEDELSSMILFPKEDRFVLKSPVVRSVKNFARESMSEWANEYIIASKEQPDKYPFMWFRLYFKDDQDTRFYSDTSALSATIIDINDSTATISYNSQDFNCAILINRFVTESSIRFETTILSLEVYKSIIPNDFIDSEYIKPYFNATTYYAYLVRRDENITQIPKKYVPFPDFKIRYLYDSHMTDGKPDRTKITNPDPAADTLYLYKIGDDADNRYEEWIYVSSAYRFERFGGLDVVLPKPDWEENDTTNNNYIQNKPFYSYTPEEILYEGNLDFTVSAGNNYYGATYVSFSRSVEFGTAVTLNIDGLEYTDTVTSSHKYIGAANPGDSNITTTKVGAEMAQNGENTFGAMNYRMVSSAERSSGTYHVKVSIKGEPVIKQIDDIYLKNSNIKNGTGNYSVQHGYSGTASGDNSHAEGLATNATNQQSHAEGNGTIASGMNSHAEGWSTVASGSNTHSEGSGTKASGTDSHAEGYYTIAKNKAQHVFGRYNEQDPSSYDSAGYGKYVEIVGNGDTNTRSNCRTLDWNGNETLAGYLSLGGSLILGNGTADEVTVTAAQLKALIALLNA